MEGLKKQNARMKEVFYCFSFEEVDVKIFTRKFTEWREVVCLIFGYKVDSTEKKQ